MVESRTGVLKVKGVRKIIKICEDVPGGNRRRETLIKPTAVPPDSPPPPSLSIHTHLALALSFRILNCCAGMVLANASLRSL